MPAATLPDSSQPPEPAPKSNFTVERLTAWALPSVAVTILLAGVWKAIGSGELRWVTGGLIIYVACLLLWFALSMMRRAQLIRPTSAAAPAPAPADQAPSQGAEKPVREMASLIQEVLSPLESPQFREAVVFARYAIWILPFLAVACLIYGNTQAALCHQVRWMTASLLSFAGCFIAWVVHLSRPWIESRLDSGAPAPPASGQPPLSLIAQLGTALLPLLSLIALAAALLEGAYTSQIKWLTAGALSFSGYLAIMLGLWLRPLRTTKTRQSSPSPDLASKQPAAGFPVQTNWVVRLLMPAVALSTLAAGLAMAAVFHQVGWTTSGLVFFSASVVVWLIQTLGYSPPSATAVPVSSSPPATVPALLLCALFALVGLATYKHEISALEAALLAVPGGLTLWFSWIFIGSVALDGPPQIESNWGGIGGGIGGWRFSDSLVYVLCALTFAVCTSFAFIEIHQRAVSNETVHTAVVLKTPATPNPGSGPTAPVGSVSKETSSPPDAKSPEK